MSPQSVDWPSLTNFQAVVGRVATTNDVMAGRATFVAQAPDGTLVGRPVDIQLPQYAFHVDEHQTRIPCIVVQAEELRGKVMFGARSITNGPDRVGLREEFELLGSTIPAQK